MAADESQEARIARLERIIEDERRRSEERAVRGRRRVRRVVGLLTTALFFGAAVGGIRLALAAPNCMQTLPAPLVTFCAGAPALAADVNGNFNTLATNLINKVGPLGSAAAGVGYEVRTSLFNVSCACPAGKVVLGGGALCSKGSPIISSGAYLMGQTSGWAAECAAGDKPGVVWAICARLGP